LPSPQSSGQLEAALGPSWAAFLPLGWSEFSITSPFSVPANTRAAGGGAFGSIVSHNSAYSAISVPELTSLAVPIGAVVFVVLLFFLKVPTPNTPVLAGLKAIDWTGSLLIVGSALMIPLGLDFGDVTRPWSSATVICLILFGAVIVGIFIINEWKFATNPVIPLRLFSTTPTVAAYSVFALNFYIFVGLAYYLPLYSQSVLGADALNSGLYLLPLIVSCSLAAAFAGVFIQQTGIYLPVMYVAQVMLTLGAGLFIHLEFEKNLTKLFIFEILVGIGVGMNIESPILAAQAATTVRDTAAVIATMGFVRSIANAVSIVVGGVIFQNEMNVANPDLVDQLGQQLASQFNGGQALANVELIETLPRDQQVLVRQAYFRALRTVWIMVRGSSSYPFGCQLGNSDRPEPATRLKAFRLSVRLGAYSL